MSQLAEDFDLSYMKHIKSRVVPAFYQLPTLNSASTFGRSCCEMQNQGTSENQGTYLKLTHCVTNNGFLSLMCRDSYHSYMKKDF